MINLVLFIAGVAITGGAVYAVGACISSLFRTLKLVREGVRVPGLITEQRSRLEGRERKNPSVIHYPVLSFTAIDIDEKIETESDVDSTFAHKHQQGTPVTVVYDPMTHTSHASTAGETTTSYRPSLAWWPLSSSMSFSWTRSTRPSPASPAGSHPWAD